MKPSTIILMVAVGVGAFLLLRPKVAAAGAGATVSPVPSSGTASNPWAALASQIVQTVGGYATATQGAGAGLTASGAPTVADYTTPGYAY